MSKIGQHIVTQIDLGNYTTNERTGEINVCLTDRKECASSEAKDTPDSVLKHGTGRQRFNRVKNEERTG